MSAYAGRIAVGAIVAVALVVALAFGLNYLLPSNTITSPGTSTLSTGITTAPQTTTLTNTTGWFGNEAPPSKCGGSNMTIDEWRLYPTGYNMSMFISTPPSPGQYYPLGSTLCFYTYLQNVKNQSSSLPISESLNVEFMNNSETAVMNHTNSTTTYFESSCPVPAYSESFGANSTGWNCLVVWNTSQPYNGLLPFAASIQLGNAFVATATVMMPNSTSSPHTSAIFGFTTTPPASTTSSSTTTPLLLCGGRFKLLTPLQSGPISLDITTDQGAILNNGTVFVTHMGTNGTANYCLRLQPNSTGYLQIAAIDGLLPTGTYNMTIFAGFNQGPGYEGSLPPIIVTASTSVEVTLSAPSGAVSMVTSTQRSSQVTTTTTTATTVENVPR